MNIRQLEYFVKVYESGSFFKAADSLFHLPAGIEPGSGHAGTRIKCTAFYRNHKGVIPTPLGQELYVSCQPALREMRTLEKHMNEFVRQNYGCLKIGLGAGCRYFISKTMWKDFLKITPYLL